MYRYDAPVAPQRNVLLAEGTQSGHRINQFLRQLDRENVDYTLSLQSGDPHTQIRQELAADEYDLVIIAAESHGRIHRLLLGELVSPLLHWLDRPILIAKPTEAV
jgi:nucleotide-binding universal stress UspA family protein